MRNKKTFKYALILGAIVPFFVFSIGLAVDQEIERSGRSPQSSEPQRMNARSENGDKDSSMAKRRVLAAVIAKMMGNQVDRAQRAQARLDQIMVRIQSRYDKLADIEGVDLSKVDPLLAQAKKQKTEVATAITKAKKDWEAFKAAAEQENGDARTAGKTFIASIRDLNKKLITFHKTLSDLVQAMKRAQPNSDDKTRCDNLDSQREIRCQPILKENNN